METRSAEGLSILMRTRGVGVTRALTVARAFPTFQELRAASPAEVGAILGAIPPDLFTVDVTAAATDLPAGVCMVGFFDRDYPDGLRDLPNPPPVIWVRGSMPDPASIAIVGTRSADDIGSEVAQRISRSAVEQGIGVVSGLAAGIDSSAHLGALRSHGKTWAILPGGVDTPTPARNVGLAEGILGAGGGLLSEVPPGTPTTRRALVARDRLQAALARATVIVQCGIPSGTLHTARFAVQTGRPLVVVKPPESAIGQPGWAGNWALIDKAGCDPRILSARGALAESIRGRRPVADHVIEGRHQYATLWDLARLPLGR